MTVSRLSKALLAAAALSAFVAPAASAAGVTVGAQVGMQSYTGDAGEGWNSALLFGATGDYALTPAWSIGADVLFSNSKHEDDGVDAATLYPGLTGTISDELKVMQFGAHAKYFLPLKGSPLHPYLVGGVGMYQAKVEFTADSYSESSDDTKLGFRGGAGAHYSVNPMFAIGAEADYHSVQTEGDALTFFQAKAGVFFNLGAK